MTQLLSKFWLNGGVPRLLLSMGQVPGWEHVLQVSEATVVVRPSIPQRLIQGAAWLLQGSWV